MLFARYFSSLNVVAVVGGVVSVFAEYKFDRLIEVTCDDGI